MWKRGAEATVGALALTRLSTLDTIRDGRTTMDATMTRILHLVGMAMMQGLAVVVVARLRSLGLYRGNFQIV